MLHQQLIMSMGLHVRVTGTVVRRSRVEAVGAAQRRTPKHQAVSTKHTGDKHFAIVIAEKSDMHWNYQSSAWPGSGLWTGTNWHTNQQLR
jgi:hypothetical protein